MAKLETLKDNFPGSSIDTSKWTNNSFSGGTISVSNNTLFGTPLANSGNTGGLVDSVGTYDLTGSYALVKVPQIVVQGGATYMQIITDGSNKFFMQADVSLLRAHKVVLGVEVEIATVAYNATTQKWWRIRESGGTIYWDYSANSITWTNLATFINVITITAMSVELEGYDFSSDTAPGSAQFQSFNIPQAANDMLVMFR